MALAACSDGGNSVPPAMHGTSGASKTAQATFTIKWTSATASAAVRRKDTISPAAQSITVAVNGVPNTVANRGANPTQSIVLYAPVGADEFLFDVYDQPNGTGHLIGTATVAQLIVDGTANVVNAAIQAVCAVTNVGYTNGDPLAKVTTGVAGVYAPTVQSIIVTGQTPATLVVAPEDVDGDVIIAGTGGTVASSITGSATVTPIDGAHISLTPVTGPRTTTPDTLTVAAPGCPSTTVAVQHSPTIYLETTTNVVTALDWYGDVLTSVTLNSGDTLIGYDTAAKKLVTYSSNGAVSQYSVFGTNPVQQYFITSYPTVVAWSNYLHQVFAAAYYSGNASVYTYNGGSYFPIGTGSLPGEPTAIAASTYSSKPYGFLAIGGQTYSFNLSNLGGSPRNAALTNTTALAPDDSTGTLYNFNFGSPWVTPLTYNLGADGSSSNFGFTSVIGQAAADTDAGNIYGIDGLDVAEAVSSSGSLLFTYLVTPGAGEAVTVVSTNEH